MSDEYTAFYIYECLMNTKYLSSFENKIYGTDWSLKQGQAPFYYASENYHGVVPLPLTILEQSGRVVLLGQIYVVQELCI